LKGLIEHKNIGGVLGDDCRLMVGGRNRTDMNEPI
jgi:hypothetical protein